MHADWLIDNIQIASMTDLDDGTGYGLIADGAVLLSAGKIVWVGPRNDLPAHNAINHCDGNRGYLTPGLIDCHTHLVYGGNRAQEFEARLQGKSYEEIARMGGGIVSTVSATRKASPQQLFASASKRLQVLLGEGVTTVEIKSGYGLDLDNELKMLRVARQLGDAFPVTVKTTFLGAHALPAEYNDRADDYIDYLCGTVMPAVAKENLADAVDVFCEGIGFSHEQCKRIFTCAAKYQLPVKAHAEQLSYLQGARLVADFNGLSADHLEYLPDEDIEYLKRHNVTPVILPGAFYYLKERQAPPVSAMRDAQLPMAIATDLNPGSSPIASILLSMNQACVLFGLTPAEALAGVSKNGAKALGLEHSKGQIKSGFDADLALWDIDHPSELSYAVNMNKPATVWVGGKRV